MKLRTLTKLDKRETKKFDDHVISENCGIIAIFSIYS